MKLYITGIVLIFTWFSHVYSQDDIQGLHQSAPVLSPPHGNAENWPERVLQNTLTRLREQINAEKPIGPGVQKENEIFIALSNEQAVETAKRAIPNIKYGESKNIVVERYEDIIRIVFPVDLPPRARGASFAAEVFLNALTGDVLYSGFDAD